MKRLIITGAGGFLGRNVIKGVTADKCFDEVIAITRGVAQLNEYFGDVDGLYIYETDSIKNGEVKVNKEDIILNCAYPRAMKGVDVTLGLDYVESIFRVAAETKVRGIVNISSQSVYDPQRDHPAVETDTPVLTDEYAIGKYCMEMLLRNVCKDIPYTNIRLASLIGPGFDVRVPNRMVKLALEKGEITTQADEQRFGYLDVEDAVKGLISLLEMDPQNWKPVYNLGGEKTYSLVEMAECIANQVSLHRGTKVTLKIIQGDASINSALSSKLLESSIERYNNSSFEKSIEKILSYVMNQEK